MCGGGEWSGTRGISEGDGDAKCVCNQHQHAKHHVWRTSVGDEKVERRAVMIVAVMGKGAP
jgi:hypothetical protein